MLVATSCSIFRMHAMSLYGIETWFMKLHKKDLNIISVVYHMAIKRTCGHNACNSNHECPDHTRLPNFKHSLARKLICFAQRLITSKCSCLMILRHYLRYSSAFRNSLEKFLSTYYQVINVFD